MFWWRKNKLSATQLWALAAGGILTQLNSEGFEALRCKATTQDSKLCLSEWWGVNQSHELAPMLEWLWTEGHSKNCLETCASLRSMGHGALDAENEPGDNLLAFVASHLKELETTQLLGWDLSRLINVARWGYTADYIGEPDAWRWIVRAAKRIQTSFSSWKSLGNDFLLGYEYWRISVAPAVKIDLGPAFNWLVASPESPWRRLPWKTELSG